MEVKRCKDCGDCVQRGAARSNVSNTYRGREPRKYYWCSNPIAKKLDSSVFGNSTPCFIGFGTMEYGSPLKLKTRPRWCPRR